MTYYNFSFSWLGETRRTWSTTSKTTPTPTKNTFRRFTRRRQAATTTSSTTNDSQELASRFSTLRSWLGLFVVVVRDNDDNVDRGSPSRWNANKRSSMPRARRGRTSAEARKKNLNFLFFYFFPFFAPSSWLSSFSPLLFHLSQFLIKKVTLRCREAE